MLPFSIGFGELVIIVVVLLLVVGPSRLPQIARTLAGAMRMARRATRELQDAISADELKEPLIRPWEEVVKARDQAIESLTSESEHSISDAETVEPRSIDQAANGIIEARPANHLVEAGDGSKLQTHTERKREEVPETSPGAADRPDGDGTQHG